MIDWSEVNWAEVFVLSVVFALLLGVVAAFTIVWVQEIIAKSEQKTIEFNQNFLRTEYERLAGESAVYQDELRDLIREVTQMTRVVREAVQSPDWDPDEHMDALALFDARLESLADPLQP